MRLAGVHTGGKGVQAADPMGQTLRLQKFQRAIGDGGLVAEALGGISKLDTGNPSLRVLLHNWTTGQLVATITPAANGAWNYRPRSTADLLVTHIGPSGYQPRSDGPITPASGTTRGTSQTSRATSR